jgi:hypothetical protein
MIRLFHESPIIGAHLGAERIGAKIRDRFYWPKMLMDINSIIKSCPECQFSNNYKQSFEPLEPIKKTMRPFSHIHIDIMGPLPKTSSGFDYVLIVVDGFTKFVIAEPLRNIKAWTVARTIVERVFTKYGCACIVTTDRGTQFTAQLFADLSELCGFTHFPNNTINSVTRDTPFFLLHGFDALLPTDINLKVNNETVDPQSSEFKQWLSERVRSAWKRAAENIEEAQITQKHQYDTKHKTKEKKLKVGNLVLIKSMNTTKFSPRFMGPYRIIDETYGPNLVVEINGNKKEFHPDRLKKYEEFGVLPLRKIDVGKNKKVNVDPNIEESESDSE